MRFRKDSDSIEVKSPPCPFCKKRITLFRHWPESAIGSCISRHYSPRTPGYPYEISPEDHKVIGAHHIFVPGELSVTEKGAWWKLPETVAAEAAMKSKKALWKAACVAVVLRAREAARPKKLTPEELHAAQSRGGRNQLKRSKRLGGENQSTEDKARGGQLGMHTRWHVRRGVIAPGCSLCVLLVDSVPESGAPSTS